MDAESENSQPLPWPLFTIDFEASSLGADSYPIEVGVCRWRSPEHRIDGWSTLIRPIPEWEQANAWSPAYAVVHGIARTALDRGMTPSAAIVALDRIIGRHTAFCDGGRFDLHWARTLARASDTCATFRLSDYDILTARCDQRGYARLVRWLERAPARHRIRRR